MFGRIIAAAFLLTAANAYCNSMGGSGYKPRVSSPDYKPYAPGWNGLAKTPSSGWRSWYAYYTDYDQASIVENIDAMATKNRTVHGWSGQVSLCDLGYCSAGLDEGWEGCGDGVNHTQHYLNGTPAVNQQKFPDMKGLVKYGHAHGLKMGFYYNGCGCAPKVEPASGWTVDYEGEIKILSEFGFDAVKFDGCGRLCNLTFYAKLMAATGKAFEIENCHWGDCTTDDASSCPTLDWCPFNQYRTSGDSDNAMGTWFHNLQTTLRFNSDWDAPLSRPGCWAYPDMLQVGRLGCSGQTSGCPPATPQILNWTRAHFAAFAIISSPLVLSIVLSDENILPIIDIIGNKQAMAINQAWAGHPGTLVRTLPPMKPKPVPVSSGDVVVGVVPDATDATQTGWTYVNTSMSETDSIGTSIMHGGRCLATTGWESDLVLTTCGNASTEQAWMYDGTKQQFSIMAPAPKKLYLGCMQSTGVLGKVDVYNCKSIAKEQWIIDGSAKTICLSDKSLCLAGRAGANPPNPGPAGVQIWAKPIGQGKVAALFINGGGLTYEGANISMHEINLTTTTVATTIATDVWSGNDAGVVSSDGVWQIDAVESLDSRFVIFEATK